MNARTTRTLSGRPTTVTLSRIASLVISAPPSPAARRENRRPDTGDWTLDSPARVKPATGPQRDHVRGRPCEASGYTDRRSDTGRGSLYVRKPRQHRGLQRDKVTHDGTKTNGPHSARIRS